MRKIQLITTFFLLALLTAGCFHTVPPENEPETDDAVNKEPKTNATITIEGYEPNSTIEITGVVLPVDTKEEVYQIATQTFGVNWDKDSPTEDDFDWTIYELCGPIFENCAYAQLTIDKETGNILFLAIQ